MKRNMTSLTLITLTLVGSIMLISPVPASSQPATSQKNATPLAATDDLNFGNPIVKVKELPVTIPLFNKESNDYVLLAWNNLGMHCVSDSDPYWILLPPANDIYAQLVKRGDSPENHHRGGRAQF